MSLSARTGTLAPLLEFANRSLASQGRQGQGWEEIGTVWSLSQHHQCHDIAASTSLTNIIILLSYYTS